ncbi:MAG: glycosyltransferase family 2 protein [archaeon]
MILLRFYEKKLPLISVIIPAYNEEKYIAECLNSLKNQQFKDFEIIVVDNNSKDSTPQIAKKYTKNVFLCKKQGISSARNYGAIKAKGKILCFIDADGIVSSNYLLQINNTFTYDNSLAALSGVNVFSTRNPLKFILYNIYNVIVFSALFIGNYIGKYYVAGNNMSIKREVFERAGCFPLVVSEDIWLSKNLRKFKPLKVRFSPFITISYSARRFEKNGFLKTLFSWIKATTKEVPEKTYKEKYN